MLLFLVVVIHKEENKVDYVYNKFLLERFLNKYQFKNKKIIYNINNFYKNKENIYKENGTFYTEKEVLEKKYNFFYKNRWLFKKYYAIINLSLVKEIKN